jgi:translation initiation factor 3 subunit C
MDVELQEEKTEKKLFSSRKSMSRFFAAASDSGSSSDQGFTTSDENSDIESDASFSQDEDQAPEVTKRNQWLVGAGGSDDSDSEDESPRGVKSLKEKKYDEMREFSEFMIDALRDKDWILVQNGKVKLTRI